MGWVGVKMVKVKMVKIIFGWSKSALLNNIFIYYIIVSKIAPSQNP